MKRASATVRIDLADANADPRTVAEALEPDDTSEMTSRLDEGVLETRIERESVGGLRSTVDDYVVNLGVALRVAESTIDPGCSTDGTDRDDGIDGAGGTDGTDEAGSERSTTDAGATGDAPAGDGDGESDGDGEDAKRQE